jgi:hypothetical protein
MSWSSQLALIFWLSHQYSICIPLLPHSCYMPCPSHPPWLDHSNYIWRRVQVMKLLIMQFSSTSCHFIQMIHYLSLCYDFALYSGDDRSRYMQSVSSVVTSKPTSNGKSDINRLKTEFLKKFT